MRHVIINLYISVFSVVAVSIKFQQNTLIRCVLGDFNCDGKINVVDATAMQKNISKIRNLSEDESLCADVNYDEEIKINDATEIQKWIAKLPANHEVGKELKLVETTILDMSETFDEISESVIVTNVFLNQL